MSVTRSWITAEGSGTVLVYFIAIDGEPEPVQTALDRETRPGVDGIGLWDMGRRGEPFTIRTLSDYTSHANANTAWTSILALQGGKVDLYWQAELWGTCAVLKVHRQTKQLIQAATGGVNVTGGASGVLQPVVWTLEALP